MLPSSLWRSPARRRRTLVDQVCDQIVQANRNSDPRVRIMFVHRFNSDFHSMFTLYVTGCDFQYGSNFWCSLESNLSGQLIYRLVVTYNSRHVNGSANCKNSSVCFVMKYCPTSTVFKNPAPVQFWSLSFVVRAFPLVLCTSAINFLCKSFNRGCGCHYQ